MKVAQLAIPEDFLELLSDAVFVEDSDHRLVLWNSQAETLLGFKSDEVVGKLRSEILVSPDNQQASVNKVLASTGVWAGTALYRSKEGRLVHVLSRRMKFDAAPGEDPHWIEICTEKSGKHNIEARMQLFQNLQDVFSSANASSVESALNAFVNMAVPLLGDICIIDLIGEDDLIRRVATATHLPPLQPLVESLKEDFPMFSGGQLTAAEVLRVNRTLIMNPIGNVATHLGVVSDSQRKQLTQLNSCAVLSVPILSFGKPIGIITLLRNHPDFVENDAVALKQYAFVLGDLIEKTRLGQRLRLETLKAESASLYKDAFLGTLSHELRTPLQAMLGWTQLLRDSRLTPDAQAKALDSLERSIKAQGKIINDLLELSRISTGRLELDAHACELQVILNSVCQSLQVSAKAKQITMTINTPKGPPIWVSADMEWLHRALWNVLSNAIKFTPTGGSVSVTINTDSSYVHVAVVDTGKGIDPAFLPYVFERFSQADIGTTRTYGGLGIGLAIVRFIVEAHGGLVEAQSTGLNKGSTFTIKLPTCPAPKVMGELQKPKTPVSGAPSLRGIRTLLVEDEQDTRELLKFILEGAGATVTEASSAKEGWEAFKKQGFDIMICDIGMPEEDGYSLMRRIRTLAPSEGGSVPAVALTAYVRNEDRVQVLRAGFQIHLAKPVEPNELIVVTHSLANRPSA